ncbi:hypothetical protein [Mesomycoplasma neurolyticum]|uniref:Uncharacterized protein n=1 Tax=Mesomycoplasma neurolyticum TaxID=2120 RepID=A0A449A6G4_9BACT|nr:hypothetical protein [Mesomycoplasma neurolyticum]VEU59826.1 Uncharacterised protein [Mesomycoplasma neurolyticum]
MKNKKINWNSRLCAKQKNNKCLIKIQRKKEIVSNLTALFILLSVLSLIFVLIITVIAVSLIIYDAANKNIKSFSLKVIILCFFSVISLLILIFSLMFIIIFKNDKKIKNKNLLKFKNKKRLFNFELRKDFLSEYFEEHKEEFQNIIKIEELKPWEFDNLHWTIIKEKNNIKKYFQGNEKFFLLKNLELISFKLHTINNKICNILIFDYLELYIYFHDENINKIHFIDKNWKFNKEIIVSGYKWIVFHDKLWEIGENFFSIKTLYKEDKIKKFIIERTNSFLTFVDDFINYYSTNQNK